MINNWLTYYLESVLIRRIIMQKIILILMLSCLGIGGFAYNHMFISTWSLFSQTFDKFQKAYEELKGTPTWIIKPDKAEPVSFYTGK